MTTLLVLAAGVGSRYGSLKQLDRLGPNGETLLDYSIFDAINSGFEKVVFIINPRMQSAFQNQFVKNLENRVDLRFVFQTNENISPEYWLENGRTKPWGTGHAVLCARGEVRDNFAIINGDDFYGKGAYSLIIKHLDELDPNQMNGCLVSYQLSNTLSNHGFVSRGICTSDKNSLLTDIQEHTRISKDEAGKIISEEESSGNLLELSGREPVSMNLMGFTPVVFDLLQKQFDKFLQQHFESKKAEFYLPSILNHMMKMGVNIPVLPTSEIWNGLTYAEDRTDLENFLEDKISRGDYPSPLWN